MYWHIRWTWYILLHDTWFDHSNGMDDKILFSKNNYSYLQHILYFICCWISSTIFHFSQFLVENRYINYLLVCLAVKYSRIQMDKRTSFTTYSYHRTRIILCDHGIDSMDGVFCICSLYTSCIKLIVALDFLSNRHVS
jgi:hypothetical protein